MSRLREDRQQKPQLTPRERLTRGLTYTAVGPVDITRGTVGLSVHGAQAAGSSVRRRYEKSRVAREIGRELAAAQEVVSGLPEALQEARQPAHRGRRWLLLTAVGVGTLAGGAVAFSIIRRSMQPEPSPRPPSVEVIPKP